MSVYPPNYPINDDYNKKIAKEKECSTGLLYMITHLIIGLFAIYLSWRCNNSKFVLGPFLVAFFCPHLYIIYALATHGGCGVFNSSS
jgi:hypothetical protein